MTRLFISLVICLPVLAQGFNPPCTLPFAAIAEERAVDHNCDLDGDGSASSKLQNRAKNNFCAQGDPALVTFFTLRQLQRAVEEEDVLGLNYTVPSSRDMLVDLHTTTERDVLGEGELSLILLLHGCTSTQRQR